MNTALVFVEAVCSLSLVVYFFAIPWRIYYRVTGKRREMRLSDYYELIIFRGFYTFAVPAVVAFVSLFVAYNVSVWLSGAPTEYRMSENFNGIYQVAGLCLDGSQPSCYKGVRKTDFVEVATDSTRLVLRPEGRELNDILAFSKQLEVTGWQCAIRQPARWLQWVGPRLECRTHLVVHGSEVVTEYLRFRTEI